MLFHVTATHSVDNCGMYNDEVREALRSYMQSAAGRRDELGIKVHFAAAGHPAHVFYLLVDADDYSSLCLFLAEIPMKQDFDIKPVRLLAFAD